MGRIKKDSKDLGLVVNGVAVSEIEKTVEEAVWAGKSRVQLSMSRFPFDIQVEMSGGPLWLEDSRWRKGGGGKVSGRGKENRPVVKLEQTVPLCLEWLWARPFIKSSSLTPLGPFLASFWGEWGPWLQTTLSSNSGFVTSS